MSRRCLVRASTGPHPTQPRNVRHASPLKSSTGAWGRAVSADVRSPAHTLVLCARAVAAVDAASGVTVYGLDGRQLASVRPPGLRCAVPSAASPVSLAPDMLAIGDRGGEAAGGDVVRCFDLRTGGKPAGPPLTCGGTLGGVGLSQGVVRVCHTAREAVRLEIWAGRWRGGKPWPVRVRV